MAYKARVYKFEIIAPAPGYEKIGIQKDSRTFSIRAAVLL